MDGKTFAKLKAEGKLDKLGEAKAIETATGTVVNAQKYLSETTKSIQGDLNQGNVSLIPLTRYPSIMIYIY
jgi:hypothetical protein